MGWWRTSVRRPIGHFGYPTMSWCVRGEMLSVAKELRPITLLRTRSLTVSLTHTHAPRRQHEQPMRRRRWSWRRSRFRRRARPRSHLLGRQGGGAPVQGAVVWATASSPLARSEHRPALAWVSGPMCPARRIERRRRIGPLRTRNASCCTTRAIPAKCQSAPKRTRHGPSRCDSALGFTRDVGDPQDRAQAAKMIAFTGASRVN